MSTLYLELYDGWPESPEEHSDRCLHDFHQKREGDRARVCEDVRHRVRERERERGREGGRERETEREDVKV